MGRVPVAQTEKYEKREGNCCPLLSKCRAVAHLRVCGGTPNWSISNGRLDARSPRVRRHRSTEPMPDPIDSSISACAEAPGAPRPRAGHKALDLRVCGGTPHDYRNARSDGARSPRVRRHLEKLSLTSSIYSSISACAEAPLSTFVSRGLLRLDLRVCGGTVLIKSRRRGASARSPRVRRHPSCSIRLKS